MSRVPSDSSDSLGVPGRVSPHVTIIRCGYATNAIQVNDDWTWWIPLGTKKQSGGRRAMLILICTEPGALARPLRRYGAAGRERGDRNASPTKKNAGVLLVGDYSAQKNLEVEQDELHRW